MDTIVKIIDDGNIFIKHDEIVNILNDHNDESLNDKNILLHLLISLCRGYNSLFRDGPDPSVHGKSLSVIQLILSRGIQPNYLCMEHYISNNKKDDLKYYIQEICQVIQMFINYGLELTSNYLTYYNDEITLYLLKQDDSILEVKFIKQLLKKQKLKLLNEILNVLQENGSLKERYDIRDVMMPYYKTEKLLDKYFPINPIP